MFHLFRSREKFVRIILGAVLLFVAFTLVYTLAPTGGMGPQQDMQVVAEVGDEKVTDMEVRQMLQLRMRDQSIPPQMAEFYVPMLVNQLVQDLAVAYAAKELGFEVTEEELATSLQSFFPQLFEGGKFAGRDQYARLVEAQGMSIAQFEDNVRKQLMMNRLEALAIEGMVVTPVEVEAEFRKKSEKLKIAYFELALDKYKRAVTATPAEMQAFYEAGKTGFRIPEKRSYLLFVVDEGQIASTVTVPEAELRAAYEARKDTYRTGERVRVRHILLMTKDKPADELPKIEKRIRDLLQQVKGGADFAELARKHSEDPGSAAKGGDVDWVVRGQMVPEFEQASFNTKVGEISGVVKTVYGFHILKVEGKEAARLKPLEEVRAELTKELSASQVAVRMQSAAEQVRSALIRSAAEAEKVAAQNGVRVVRVEKAGGTDPVPEVGVNEDFRDAVAQLPKNGVTGVISISDAKTVVAQVTDVFPSRQAEYSEVEEQARAGVIAKKSTALFEEKVAELKKRLAEPGADLQKLAKEFGAEVKTPGEFGRDGAVEGVGPATLMEEGFSKGVGEVFGPVRISGGQAFACKVADKIPADLTALAAQREQLVQAIKSRKAKERRDLFADGVLKRMIDQKKVKINNTVVQRIAASYRGA